MHYKYVKEKNHYPGFLNMRPEGAARRHVLIDNVRMAPAGEGAIDVRFNVAWDHSWRCEPGEKPVNWDAAWIFLKYREDSVFTVETDDSEENDLWAHAAKADGRAMARVQWETDLTTDADDQALADGFRKLLNARLRVISCHGPSVWLKFGGEGATLGRDDMASTKYCITRLEAPEGRRRHRVSAPSPWLPGKLSPSSADHRVPAGAVVEAAEDGRGVFIHRDQQHTGLGPVAFHDVHIRWLLNHPPNTPVDIWVMGLEMVYIPQGPFWLGDPLGPESDRAEVTGAFHSVPVAHEGNRC